jgi:hypothetical protein
MMGSKPSIDIGVMVHRDRNWSSGLGFDSFYISKQLSTSVLNWKLNGVALAPLERLHVRIGLCML